MSSSIGGEPIDEIMVGPDGAMDGGIVLLTYTERSAPPTGETILGFATDDIHALFARGVAAGGTVVGEIRDPDVAGVKLVGFIADPQGHLAEVIERA